MNEGLRSQQASTLTASLRRYADQLPVVLSVPNLARTLSEAADEIDRLQGCERGVRIASMRYFRETREGFRQLCSREFWRAFRDYWRPEAISARLDAWNARQKEHRDGR